MNHNDRTKSSDPDKRCSKSSEPDKNYASRNSELDKNDCNKFSKGPELEGIKRSETLKSNWLGYMPNLPRGMSNLPGAMSNMLDTWS